MGYHKAGFEVVGVDIEPQPNYPFEFIQSDAIEFILKRGHEFDAVAGSPPCQEYTKATAIAKARGKTYPDLVDPTRKAMRKAGRPYVMENVPQSPLRPDVILTGNMFNLPIIRKRHFETSFFMFTQPLIPEYRKVGNELCSIWGKASQDRCSKDRFGFKTIREAWAFAMGIDWHMTEAELAEAIPPAYTEYIGRALLQTLYNLNHSSLKIPL